MIGVVYYGNGAKDFVKNNFGEPTEAQDLNNVDIIVSDGNPEFFFRNILPVLSFRNVHVVIYSAEIILNHMPDFFDFIKIQQDPENLAEDLANFVI